MGYVIVAGAGLAVGLGLMIWALTERGKRHEAERKADEAEHREQAQRELANQNASAAQNLEMQHGRMSEQLSVLRKALEEARTRLAESGDPEAVKTWLDEELKGGEV
jgi:uncharacterized protein HemX